MGPAGCLPGPGHDPLCSRGAALLVTPLSHVPLQGRGPGPAPAAPPPARGLPKEGQPCRSGVSRPQGSCLQPPNYITDPTEGPSWESITGTGPHRGSSWSPRSQEPRHRHHPDFPLPPPKDFCSAPPQLPPPAPWTLVPGLGWTRL